MGDPSTCSIIVSCVKAIVARLLLYIHAVLVVWRTSLLGNDFYWLFLLALVGSILDLIFIIRRKGMDWKWFSPTILFYLVTTVPCIWLLELDVLRLKQEGLDEITVALETGGNVPAELAEFANLLHNSFNGSEWVIVLQQMMLLFLIISRWIMPVSEDQITRDQLSQLLLVYVAIGADILQFFDIFQEPQLLNNDSLIYGTLVVWSFSLLLFTVVLTATKKDDDDDDSCCSCLSGDVWRILVMSIMLDLPFLVYRLVAIGAYGVHNLTIYFFTSKNGLVLLLQMYRLCVIVKDKDRDWRYKD